MPHFAKNGPKRVVSGMIDGDSPGSQANASDEPGMTKTAIQMRASLGSDTGRIPRAMVRFMAIAG